MHLHRSAESRSQRLEFPSQPWLSLHPAVSAASVLQMVARPDHGLTVKPDLQLYCYGLAQPLQQSDPGCRD